jgi:hypothetical protein
MPPTAITASPVTAATLVPRGRPQIRLNAPMEGSLPPSRRWR